MVQKPNLHVVGDSDDDSLRLPKSLRREIGARLERSLDHAKVSQTAAARTAGVSKAAVNHWVHGKNLPGVAALYRIAQEHRLSVDYIIFGVGHSPDVLDLARAIHSLPPSQRDALRKLFGSGDAPPPRAASNL